MYRLTCLVYVLFATTVARDHSNRSKAPQKIVSSGDRGMRS
jgi:hypothetical protein